jgi:DNA polymerase III delta prime subunit
VLWIDSKGAGLKVSDAEMVLEHLAMVPQSRSRGLGGPTRPARVVVLIDVDLFNDFGINRLLKTLEEAPENAQIILTSSRMFGILPTLLSRSIKWHVPPPALDDSLALLKRLCDPAILAEYSEAELILLLKRCGLSPGKALATLDPQKKDQEFHELCRNLVNPEKIFNAIEYAEWVASAKPTVDSVANEVELAINQCYRQEFLVGRNHHLNHHYLQSRRQLLRQAKHFAGRKRISLNVQLFAETLGLTQLGVDE